MWWSRRSVLALPLAISACGYSSVYAPGSNGGGQLQNAILVQEPSTRDQFLLVQQLERRLGRGQAPSYRLTYGLSVISEALAISVSGARTRYNITGTVSFSLVDEETGAVVLSDRIQNFTAYSAAGTTIATFAAEQDARERLMVTLADQMTTRLLAADLS